MGSGPAAAIFAEPHPMNPHSSLVVFRCFLAEVGFAPASLPVSRGVTAFVAFYRSQRAAGRHADDGGMLLYQWGTTATEGGEFFDLNLTRQFVLGGAEDEDIWQLSLTFRFTPSGPTRAAGSGNEWCPSPEMTADFERFVRGSAAFKVASVADPMGVDLTCRNVG